MIQNKKNIILIGGGGHCKSCIEVIESTDKYNIVGVLDLPSELGKKVLCYEIIGNDDDIVNFAQNGYAFLITVGQIKSSLIRQRLYKKLKNNGATIATLISPYAHISKYAEIGEGAIVMPNVCVNAGAVVGKNCILNTGCNIEHDVFIGDYSHISTHAVVNGNCIIGQSCFVGSNSTISNNVSLGNNTIVGAGSLVLKSFQDNCKLMGNPAKLHDL